MKLFEILIIIFLVSIGILWGTISYFPDWNTRGQFGDLFGSINALFSGLAFGGLLYTIILQRDELAMQREELRLQREEMAKSRGELAEQAKIQRAQFAGTVAQIRVAEKQANIEAQKMIAEQYLPNERASQIDAIQEIAQQLNVQAGALEEKLEF